MKKTLIYLALIGPLGLSGCGSTGTATTATTTTNTTSATQNDPNVKIINGKRYVYIRADFGSNLGGRWVPEGSPEARAARQSGSLSVSTIQNTQNHDDGTLNPDLLRANQAVGR